MINKILKYINTDPKEVWKFVIQEENVFYFISNCGRFLSATPINEKRRKKPFKVKIIAPYSNKKGYMIVRTINNGKKNYYQVHRLVLKVFLPTDNMETLQVNHIDGNKSNNNLSNLEWCTGKENIEHALKTGLIKNTKAVYQYDLDGNFLKEFESITQAEKETSVFGANISACCKNKVRQAGGFQWRYYKQNNIGKVRAKKIADDLKTRYCKMVAAFQNGIEVRRFNSVLEASEFIGKPNANVNISACALGKRKTAYGYNWQYI